MTREELIQSEEYKNAKIEIDLYNLHKKQMNNKITLTKIYELLTIRSLFLFQKSRI